jgi:hypothetical protein
MSSDFNELNLSDWCDILGLLLQVLGVMAWGLIVVCTLGFPLAWLYFK